MSFFTRLTHKNKDRWHNDRIFRVLGETVSVAKAVVHEALDDDAAQVDDGKPSFRNPEPAEIKRSKEVAHSSEPAPSVTRTIILDGLGETPSFRNPYILDDEEVEQSGVKRESGPHGWGTGEVPYQHEPWFQGFGKNPRALAEKYEYRFNKFTADLKKEGWSDRQIADAMGITLKTLKARRAISSNLYHQAQIKTIDDILSTDPYISNNEIARRTGWADTTVGSLRKELSGIKDSRSSKQRRTTDALKSRVDEVGYVDVSEGSEYWMDATKSRLENAVEQLVQQGYVCQKISVQQQTNLERWTDTLVLAKPGETKESILAHKADIKPPVDVEEHEGTTLGLRYKPESIDSKRIMVRYAEEGGKERDGLIELRRGVEDISLGQSNYAQVRIAVDGTHYMKGVAVYSDDMPPGVDVIYNSKQNKGASKDDVYKPLKHKFDDKTQVDWDNPFGATVKEGVEGNGVRGGQRTYIGEDGKEHLSVINKINEEGDWLKWNSNNTLATQMLSKQTVELAKKQIDLSVSVAKSKLDEILALENPVMKRQYLLEYADKCERQAVDMQTVGLPRQGVKVIVPITDLKDNQIYAPGLPDGTSVVCIRYPHEGLFQIPSLTVNNKSKLGRKTLGAAPDAVGISAKTAEQMSGADFDGDTVLVIPNDGSIQSKRAIKDLVEFDAKVVYAGYPGMKRLDKHRGYDMMGQVSNLITDMTLQNAPLQEIVRAVKFANTIIDAHKHSLNWEQAESDLKIKELRAKYQPGNKSTTLIARAKGEHTILDREEGDYIVDPETGKKHRVLFDPETGDKIYRETGRTERKSKKVIDPETGEEHWETKVVPKKIKVENMAYTNDARTLISKGQFPMEVAYADYANQLKQIARDARKATLSITIDKKDPVAAKVYASEVASLKAKLIIAKKRAPIERMAQRYAGLVVEAKLREHPELKLKENEDELKRLRTQATSAARYRFSGKRKRDSFDVTPKEWEAIQAKAVSKTTLEEIMRYADESALKQYALPKQGKTLLKSQISTIKAMANKKTHGDFAYTQEEIADALGISATMVSKVLLGEVA